MEKVVSYLPTIGVVCVVGVAAYMYWNSFSDNFGNINQEDLVRNIPLKEEECVAPTKPSVVLKAAEPVQDLPENLTM